MNIKEPWILVYMIRLPRTRMNDARLKLTNPMPPPAQDISGSSPALRQMPTPTMMPQSPPMRAMAHLRSGKVSSAISNAPVIAAASG